MQTQKPKKTDKIKTCQICGKKGYKYKYGPFKGTFCKMCYIVLVIGFFAGAIALIINII